MKFNNKLNLVDYLKVVNEITSDFFDDETYEFTPHVGEINALRAYYDHCVELEEGEGEKKPIENIMDMQELYDNIDLMSEFVKQTSDIENMDIDLTFGHAYYNAMEIVSYKKASANSFANATTYAIKSVLDAFKSSFSEEEVNKIYELAKQISSGKITNQGIVDAYESKFLENEDKEEPKKDDGNVIKIKKKKTKKKV